MASVYPRDVYGDADIDHEGEAKLILNQKGHATLRTRKHNQCPAGTSTTFMAA